MKKISRNFTDKLQPGTWNKVEIVIKPATAEELGHIEMTLETNIVALN